MRGRNGGGNGEPEAKPRDVKWNDPEPLIGDGVDLGALATEYLMVGLFIESRRKPGAVFEAPQDVKPDPGPFAALAGLKEKHGR